MTAILLILFRRENATRQLINRLREVKPSRIYVAADGPRPQVLGERDRCETCRTMIEEIDWPCEIHRRFSDVNQGCRWGPVNAINWFFEHEPEGIILEDDILPDPTFFRFCTELLARYRETSLVGCICGYNFLPQISSKHSYLYSKLPLTWGWATWRDRWRKFAEVSAGFERNLDVLDLRDWLSRHDQKDIKRKVHKAFTEDHVWDFLWMFALWSSGLVSVLPVRSLTRNLGIGSDATHTRVECSILLSDSTPMGFPLRHPPHVQALRSLDQKLFRDLLHTPTLFERIDGLVRSRHLVRRIKQIILLRIRLLRSHSPKRYGGPT